MDSENESCQVDLSEYLCALQGSEGCSKSALGRKSAGVDNKPKN